MAEVIQTENLTRYYGDRCVVSDLNLSVPRGCIFGLLGRNGAGKTTTLRMLLGLETPTRGSSTVLGHPSQALPPVVRNTIGYLTEEHAVYGHMRVVECGEFQSRFYASWNDDVFRGVLDHFRLEPRARVKELSRGQRAGLCLALTLAPEPELLILDDPALGLDPVARRSLLEAMLYVTRREGRTILLSSHLLADIERVADRIAILDRGVLLAQCPVDTFREHIKRVVLSFRGEIPPMPEIPGLLHSSRTTNEVALTIANYTDDVKRTLEALPLERLAAAPLSLEEAFVSYVGERGEKRSFLENVGGVS